MFLQNPLCHSVFSVDLCKTLDFSVQVSFQLVTWSYNSEWNVMIGLNSVLSGVRWVYGQELDTAGPQSAQWSIEWLQMMSPVQDGSALPQ